ncbi:alpha-ketoglutarate-dependent taurine dioxygenase [Streptomyces sp. AK010]|nr:alpha-ketoglutarate-dependent taurine dioxygenase [Streptomyces sp. AK010]
MRHGSGKPGLCRVPPKAPGRSSRPSVAVHQPAQHHRSAPRKTLTAGPAAARRNLPESLRNLADTLWAEHTNGDDNAVPEEDVDEEQAARRVPQDPRPAPGLRHPAGENTLRHRWSPNQLVLFGTRITQHYAVDNYDGRPRRLHLVTVAGDIPVGIEGKESYVIEGDASHYSPVAALPHRATRLSG